MATTMAAMSRLSNLFYVLLGAVAVGAVVAVLAVVGALPDKVERTTVNSPIDDGRRTAVHLPGLARLRAHERRRHLPAGLRQRGLRLRPRRRRRRSPSTGRAAARPRPARASSSTRPGHIVTNDHVVEDADKFTVRFGEEGDPIPAKLVGKDPSSDLAVLSIDPKAVKGGVKPLQLASSKSLRPGEAAIAIGSPFGLSGTVTTGIISALGREIEAPNGFSIPGAVQTDAAINPGNSGGPLLDADGRVIGVNSQIASSGGGNSGVGFAVPVDSIRDVVPKLLKDGKIDRAYLGLASGERPATPGALVGTVNPGTPADEAGIRTGDLIVAFDGKTVRNPSELSLAVLQKQPGDEVKVELKRGERHPHRDRQARPAPEPGGQ